MNLLYFTFAVINMCHFQTQKINAFHWPVINTLKTHHDKITCVVYLLIKQLWLLLYEKELTWMRFLSQSTNQRPRSLFPVPVRIAVKRLCLLLFRTLTTFKLLRNLPKIPWRDKLDFLSSKNFLQIQLFSGMVWHGRRKVLYPVS